MFNEELRVLVLRAVIGVWVDDELRIQDVLLHDEEVDRGHDHLVPAVHDECWLLDSRCVNAGWPTIATMRRRTYTHGVRIQLDLLRCCDTRNNAIAGPAAKS